MNAPRGRIFDELSRFATDAVAMAQGVKREAETVARTQAERLLSTMDVVQREEFEAVRDMALKARAENDRLTARLAELEARLEKLSNAPPKQG
jgi:BMFP domain-containing protein YqiC